MGVIFYINRLQSTDPYCLKFSQVQLVCLPLNYTVQLRLAVDVHALFMPTKQNFIYEKSMRESSSLHKTISISAIPLIKSYGTVISQPLYH